MKKEVGGYDLIKYNFSDIFSCESVKTPHP